MPVYRNFELIGIPECPASENAQIPPLLLLPVQNESISPETKKEPIPVETVS